MHKGVIAVFERKSESQEHRCLCGSLLARITQQGIELKCRKCKQLQVIPNSRIIGLQRAASAEHEVGVYASSAAGAIEK